jgi:hypothetical protein
VTKRIRVDTDGLIKCAKEIDLIASQTGKTGDKVYQSTYSLNDYGGQLPTKKAALTAQRDAKIIRDDLAEDAEQLRVLAGKFEAVDNETIGSFIPRPPYELPTPWFQDFLHSLRWGWDPNTPDGYVTRLGDNKFGSSQFIDLEELFGDEKYYVDNSKEISRGLCGELCAFHHAGIKDLKSAFQKILDSGDDDLILHLKNDINLQPEDMQRLLKISGLKTGETQMIPQGTMLSPEAFQNILDDGGQVAVLVNIDSKGKFYRSQSKPWSGSLGYRGGYVGRQHGNTMGRGLQSI